MAEMGAKIIGTMKAARNTARKRGKMGDMRWDKDLFFTELS